MFAFLGRSGSGAILNDLDHHPKTIIHWEIFGERNLPGDVEQTDANRIAFLRQLWAGYRNPEWMPPELRGCARGFKLQFHSHAPQFGKLRKLAGEMDLHGAAVIALRRRDTLRQAISALRARRLVEISVDERGVEDFHINPRSGPRSRAFATEPIEIDLHELNGMIEMITVNRREMDRFLGHAPPALEVAYEDYLADRLGVLNRILVALELEPFAEAPPQDLAKVTDDDLSKAVINYDEVRGFAEKRGLKA